MKHNVLKIGTTGTETPFLPESELPECSRLTLSSDFDMSDNEKQIKDALEESKKMQQSKEQF